MTLQAPSVVFVKPDQVEIWNMAMPDPLPNEVGVRTIFSGVSQGTERSVLTGRYNRMGENPAGFYPCSPGYQAAGIVETVGEHVTDLTVGDHVFVPGTRLADPAWKYPGPCMASHTGYLVAPRTAVVRLSPEVDLASASLYHMAAVSFHGARLTNIRQGELVVVIGQGVIGQMSAQAARLRGARVITADTIQLRVDLSARYSADLAVNVSFEDLQEVIRKEAPEGADVIVDTTGNSSMVGRCVDLVRREGRICLQGYYPDPIQIDFHSTHLKRVTVSFPCGWDSEDQTHLGEHLAAGRIQIEPLITHHVSYYEAPQMYKMILEKPEASLAIVINWQAEA